MRVGEDANQQSPIKITAEIEGTPLSIEGPDLETAKAVLKLAWHFQTNGGPDVLSYEDVALSEPGAGQARVKIEAVGVNYADIY